jgi:Rieske Fe-S protein
MFTAALSSVWYLSIETLVKITCVKMMISRRQFLLLTAGLAAGCQAVNDVGTPAARAPRIINAGATSNYAIDGVYSNFRGLGFFVIRRGDQLFALSAICTHRKCKLNVQRDHSFLCPCHGSTFDAAGHVTEGPAKRDLPMFPSYTNEQGQLIVNVPMG